MATLLWARWDEREDGSQALTFFRRQAVDTIRGQMLQDIPVLVVEDVKGKVKDVPEAVELELDAHRDADGSIAIFAKAKATNARPKDPVLKRTKFDDPESERAKKAKRGMGRFLGKETASKPASKGAAPPVPREQRVGGRGAARGRRKRGAAVRGAPRDGGKK